MTDLRPALARLVSLRLWSWHPQMRTTDGTLIVHIHPDGQTVCITTKAAPHLVEEINGIPADWLPDPNDAATQGILLDMISTFRFLEITPQGWWRVTVLPEGEDYATCVAEEDTKGGALVWALLRLAGIHHLSEGST